MQCIYISYVYMNADREREREHRTRIANTEREHRTRIANAEREHKTSIANAEREHKTSNVRPHNRIRSAAQSHSFGRKNTNARSQRFNIAPNDGRYKRPSFGICTRTHVRKDSTTPPVAFRPAANNGAAHKHKAAQNEQRSETQDRTKKKNQAHPPPRRR